MLNITHRSDRTFRSIAALLVFISCVTFQTLVSAGVKENTAEEYRALGYEEQQKGNVNGALSYYTKATSLGLDNNAVLLNDMGVLYEDIDFYARAEAYYQKSIQSDPNYLPPYLNVAYLYQRLGRSDEAAQYFKKRFEFGDPGDPWAQKAKVELLKIDPRYQEWVSSVEAELFNRQLERKSRDEFNRRVEQGQEHFLKGNSLLEEEKYERALMEYDQALYFSPDNPRMINARKKAILETVKKTVREQTENAIKWLEVGDTLSARHEIQRILNAIPNEPMMISPQDAW